MGLFNNLFRKGTEQNEDSVYNRRKERGELPEQLKKQIHLRKQLEEQQRIVDALEEENRKLRSELQDAYERLERAEYIHSIDDLIDAMKQPAKEDVHYNPFTAFIRTADLNGGGASSGSDADSSMSGNALEPDQYCDNIPDDAEFGDEGTDIDDIGDDER